MRVADPAGILNIGRPQDTTPPGWTAARECWLWHAVLFYTIGQLVADRIPGYIPYADENGLWTRAWPAPDRSLIEQDWKPHMNDSVSLQRALTNLVNDFASAQQRKSESESTK